jgi:hypothetical protein
VREVSKVSGGVDALLEKEPVKKEWQEIQSLVEAEAVEAKAQESLAQSAGCQDDAGSPAGAGASAAESSGNSASAGASEAEFLDKLAKEHMRAYVKLIPEPTTMEGVEQAVRQSGLKDIHGQERRNVFMITLNADNLNELAGRAPHRKAPVELELLKKLVQGALLGRGGIRETDENPVAVPAGDVVALHDGGRPSVQQLFLDIWKPTHKVLGTVVKHSAVDMKVKKVTLVMNEETVRQLKARVRGSNAYTLVHTCTLVSEMDLVPDMCPEKARVHYSGYNVGDALGFINLENYAKLWHAEVQKKRDIYGARMLQLREGADEAAGPPPKLDDLQPAFYHALPPEYYLECIHSYNVVGVLDLSCGGGQVAQACLTKRIPYLGFCLTEAHVIELEKFLVTWVRDMMCTEGHPLCRKGAATKPAAAAAMPLQQGGGDDGDTKKDNKKKKKKAKSSDEESEAEKKKKKKQKTSAKKKKKKKSSDEDESAQSFDH